MSLLGRTASNAGTRHIINVTSAEPASFANAISVVFAVSINGLLRRNGSIDCLPAECATRKRPAPKIVNRYYVSGNKRLSRKCLPMAWRGLFAHTQAILSSRRRYDATLITVGFQLTRR